MKNDIKLNSWYYHTSDAYIKRV